MTNISETKFVGIDVSKATLEVALDDRSATERFDNNRAGLTRLVRSLKAHLVTVVVLEATGGLEREAAVALHQADYRVMVVNPRQAHDFAKALGYLSKTDHTDARVLSHFARTLHAGDKRDTLLFSPPTAEQELLAAMLTRRSQLVCMRVSETNRLDVTHKTQQKSVKVVIALLDHQIKALDGDIGGRLASDFKEKLALLKGLKGVGQGTQAALMGYLPELGQLSERALAKLVGVAPLNRDSGTFKGKRTTWGGRDKVRCALYMAVLTAMRREPTIRAFYQRLSDAGKPKKVAIVACMRKLLTIMNAVIKSGKPWQENYPQGAESMKTA